MTGGLDKYWGEKGLPCIGHRLAFCSFLILTFYKWKINLIQFKEPREAQTLKITEFTTGSNTTVTIIPKMTNSNPSMPRNTEKTEKMLEIIIIYFCIPSTA